MSRRTESRRRLSAGEVVFHTASGATIIATAPNGRPPRRPWYRSVTSTRARRSAVPRELISP